MYSPLIIVHGGAGRAYIKNKKRKEERKKVLKEAAEKGFLILLKGGSSLDAVTHAVKILEDHPLFNAGYGSALNIEKEVEMDAAVAREDGLFGAVAGIKRVKNPILVARKVAEETEHIILVGEGATRFARLYGFEDFNPVTEERLILFERLKPSYFKNIEKFKKLYGTQTVGAVAIDKRGIKAVATSTGGLMFHLPGRVGDTPLIGCGTYASPLGVCSATGHGEEIIRNMVAKEAVELLKKQSAPEAAKTIVKRMKRKGCEVGIILIDKEGNPGIAYNTEMMDYTVKAG